MDINTNGNIYEPLSKVNQKWGNYIKLSLDSEQSNILILEFNGFPNDKDEFIQMIDDYSTTVNEYANQHGPICFIGNITTNNTMQSFDAFSSTHIKGSKQILDNKLNIPLLILVSREDFPVMYRLVIELFRIFSKGRVRKASSMENALEIAKKALRN